MKKIFLALFAVTPLMVLSYYVGSKQQTTSHKDVRGNVNIEYLLEVTEDSVFIENYESGVTYSGRYDQLKDLVISDNQ